MTLYVLSIFLTSKEYLLLVLVRSQCLLSCTWIWTIFLYQLPCRNGSWWHISFSSNSWGMHIYFFVIHIYVVIPSSNHFFPLLDLIFGYIFMLLLQDRMREANRNNRVPKFVRRIEIVQKRSIMYYQQQGSQPFLKIVVALPTMVTTCRGMHDLDFPIYLSLL